ncbi:MAG: hypothetical protein JRH15_07615 [Deltaproteobacteria bacterium]|nr:hypothetical protein [Deltaproteobacteria bacterium]
MDIEDKKDVLPTFTRGPAMTKMHKKLSLIAVLILAMLSAFLLISGYADASAPVLNPQDIRENIYGSTIVSDAVFVMVGDRGKIFRSSDQGATWQEIPSNTRRPLFSVSFSDSKNGWICGKSGLILNTTDGGMTWSAQDSGKKKQLFSIDFGDALRGCAVGDWGAIVRTEDGGATWQDVSLSDDVVLYGVQFANASEGWIAAEFGKIFKTKDGGLTWREGSEPSQEGKTFFCLTRDGDSLYAAGLDGVIVYSRDQGLTWARARNESVKSLYGITIRGQTGWAVGDAGTILRSADGGASWQMVETPKKNSLFWIGTVALKNSEPHEAIGFGAGANGLFLSIKYQTVTW